MVDNIRLEEYEEPDEPSEEPTDPTEPSEQPTEPSEPEHACVDENKDHACDYGCSVAIGEHADSAEDADHVCDYGCGAVLEACTDTNNDHNCDVCGDKLSECTAGDVVIENKVDSTYEAVGSYDEVTYCTVCGKELSRETKAALLNPFYNQSMNLAGKLTMMFNIKWDTLDSEEMAANGYYVVITKTTADGTRIDTTIPMSEWETRSQNRYRFAYDQLAAKEMSDKLEVVLYNSANEQVSVALELSVASFAMSQIEKYENDASQKEYVTALVDMLNYGAAAQDYFFDYNIENLANAALTENQKAFATTDVVYDPVIDNSGFAAYQSTALELESNVYMNLIFYKNDFGVDISEVVATVQYSSHSDPNTKLEKTILGTEFLSHSTQSSTGKERCKISIDWLDLPDGKQVVTVVFKDLEGNVLGEVSESITMRLGNWAERYPDEPVYRQMIKFMNSAYDYFH